MRKAIEKVDSVGTGILGNTMINNTHTFTYYFLYLPSKQAKGKEGFA